jgi:hypothetical protein
MEIRMKLKSLALSAAVAAAVTAGVLDRDSDYI